MPRQHREEGQGWGLNPGLPRSPTPCSRAPSAGGDGGKRLAPVFAHLPPTHRLTVTG